MSAVAYLGLALSGPSVALLAAVQASATSWRAASLGLLWTLVSPTAAFTFAGALMVAATAAVVSLPVAGIARDVRDPGEAVEGR